LRLIGHRSSEDNLEERERWKDGNA